MKKISTKRRKAWTLLMFTTLTTAFMALTLSTFAYFISDGYVENYLNANEFRVDLLDIFENGQFSLPGDTLNKDVSMINNGELPAIVRIRLTPSWNPVSDAGGNLLDTAAAEILFGPGLGTDWVAAADGWYYYTKILHPGDETSFLVEGLQLDPFSNDIHAADYSGGTYTLGVLGQSLQAYPEAAEENWLMTYVDVAGTLTWTPLAP